MAEETAVTDEASAPVAANAEGQDEGFEYEAGFTTPFGRIELELEPRSRKERKDAARRERAAMEATKRAERAARLAAEKAERAAARRGRAGGLLTVLLVVAVIGAIIAVAWWLFANPGEDEEDERVPPHLREDEAAPTRTGGLGARLKDALRAGRRASREAQEQERRRFEELARK
jgi:hypothetical protein